MDTITFLLLSAAGVLAGFIDSIAGGGGLITVPIFTLLLGPGALAIGTNKVVAVCSSLVAFLVYLRGGHVTFRRNISFVMVVGLGAVTGASLSPFIPKEIYRWLLVVIGPVILWVVYRKDLWVRKEIEAPSERRGPLFFVIGFACGLYDGIAGPGGGTLMFLSLFLLARLPLLAAMATAKLANLASASLSLLTFAATGHVRWATGFNMALGISLGAFLGAHLAPRGSISLARTALMVITSFLLLRLIYS